VIRFANNSRLAVLPRQKADDVDLHSGNRVGVCIRAESLRFTDEGGFCSGELTDVEYSGSGYLCVARTDLGEMKMEVPGSVKLPVRGQSVRLAVNEATLHLVNPS